MSLAHGHRATLAAKSIWRFKVPGRIGFNTTFRFPAGGQPYKAWQPDLDTEFTKLAADGILWLRDIAEWRFIETSKGVFDWSAWDTLLTKAGQHGINYLPSLMGTPTWANPAVDYNSPPANNQDFADFCSAFVHRYGPGGTFSLPIPVRQVELWNEPWGYFGWKPDPDPAAYAALARAGATAIRAANPQVKTMLCADPYQSRSDGNVTTPFFSAVITADNTLKSLIDIYFSHPYPNPLFTDPYNAGSIPQQSFDRIADSITAADAWVGGPTEHWITEWGSTNATGNVRGVSEATSGTFTTHALTHVLRDFPKRADKGGVEKIFVHSYWRAGPGDLTVVEDHYPVLHTDGTPKPAYTALTAFTK